MKQKLLDKILYVFDVTPYEITEDTDAADVIKVQSETYEGFVALNPDLADKIVKYNYHMLTVNRLEWADYVDEPDPVSPELAWSANTATVTINADDNVYPTLTNPNSVTVAYTSSDTEKATINASSGVITLVAAGNTTISAVFEGNDTYEAQTVTYVLTINAESVNPEPVFETLYITQAQDYELSASLQTDTDWTDKTVYAQDEGMNFYLKMVPDTTDPTLLVLDTDYDGNVADETYLDSNPTGTVTVSNLVEDLTYTCDYSWTNEAAPSECTVTFTGSGANDTCINVEVGGSLITDFTDYIVDPEAATPVFTVSPDSEIKIYPLYNQEDYSVTCADADVNVDDSDQYYWYVAIPNDTTITVDYTDPNAM